MKIAPVLLLFLALSACGPSRQPDCISACGSRVFGATCAEFGPREVKVLSRFPEDTCRMLRGVTISVQADEKWAYGEGNTADLTWCQYRSIQVGRGLAGYPHGVAHLRECPIPDLKHERWTWEWLSIEEASR